MAIVNRDVDVSQQKEQINVPLPALVGTAATLSLWIAPFPCEVKAVEVVAWGLSGAPFWNFEIMRFAGGNTAILGGVGTLTVTTVGTSGPQACTLLVSAGNTLLQFQAGDWLQLRTGAANTAALAGAVNLVVKKLQDIVSHFGSST